MVKAEIVISRNLNKRERVRVSLPETDFWGCWGAQILPQSGEGMAGSLLPPPQACSGPVHFTPHPPCHPGRPRLLGRSSGQGGVPGRQPDVLSPTTPRASSPALPGAHMLLLLHKLKARLDHRFGSRGAGQGGTRPSTPFQPQTPHFSAVG